MPDPGKREESSDKTCLVASWLQTLCSLWNYSSLSSLQHFVAAKDSIIFLSVTLHDIACEAGHCWIRRLFTLIVIFQRPVDPPVDTPRLADTQLHQRTHTLKQRGNENSKQRLCWAQMQMWGWLPQLGLLGNAHAQGPPSHPASPLPPYHHVFLTGRIWRLSDIFKKSVFRKWEFLKHQPTPSSLNKRQQKAIPSDVYLSSVRFKNQLGKSSVNQAYYREKHSRNLPELRCFKWQFHICTS